MNLNLKRHSLDVTFTKATSSRGTLVIYPCIGGTTRLYSIPIPQLVSLQISVLEFHPPAHGRSTGQMTMSEALDCFESVLSNYGVSDNLVTLGHSAGANALLQFQRRSTNFQPKLRFFVQPVFDFAESAKYMYKHGHQEELFLAISKWVKEPHRLRELLLDSNWLKSEFWMENKLREKIDSMSQGIFLGEFLEDFYLRDNGVADLIGLSTGRTFVYVSKRDHWYNPLTIWATAKKYNVEAKLVPAAEDHFFTNSWPDVWREVLGTMQSFDL